MSGSGSHTIPTRPARRYPTRGGTPFPLAQPPHAPPHLSHLPNPQTFRTRRYSTRAATPKHIRDSLPNTTVTQPADLCPVCKDPFVVNTEAKILPCTHIYHSQCILPWLEISNTCPLCRFTISEEEEEISDDDDYVEVFDEAYAAFLTSMTQHMDRVRRNNRVYETNIDQDYSDWLSSNLVRIDGRGGMDL